MTSTPSSKPCTEEGVVRTLLASIVDYAGLFPPAEQEMEAAAAAFSEYRRGPHAWMLGSFVVTAPRVPELARVLGSRSPSTQCPISVIVASPEEGARTVQAIHDRFAELLSVRALEVRPLLPDAVHAEVGAAQWAALTGRELYYEVPLDDRLEHRLDAVAAVGGAAKLRTGGVTPDAFPEAAGVADFVTACSERGLAFKATAGLHHAFPGSFPLTYAAASPRGRMHGFVGLALVATLVQAGRVDRDESAAMLDAGRQALQVEGDALLWCGNRLTEEDLARSRRDFFRCFGSCSFEEPVVELQASGLL